MEKSKEKCPECGKKYKFLKKHMKRAHSTKDIPGKSPGKVQEISNNFFKEINLKGEFDKMTDKINPKKKEEKKGEMKYHCNEEQGGCGMEFNIFGEGHTCPGCGVEF
jgi:hypothetical protein